MAVTKTQLSPVDIEARSKIDFNAGDTVRVWSKILDEKGKTRLQALISFFTMTSRSFLWVETSSSASMSLSICSLTMLISFRASIAYRPGLNLLMP